MVFQVPLQAITNMCSVFCAFRGHHLTPAALGFCCRPNEEKQLQHMAQLECHLLVVHGEKSHMVSQEDADRLLTHAGADVISKQVCL